MRWTIRCQLLVPLLTLLLIAVAISAWTGYASAQRARQQIETQVRNVARALSEPRFPLTKHVLEQMKDLSGAEYALIDPESKLLATTLGTAQDFQSLGDFGRLSVVSMGDDWQKLQLGPPVQIRSESFLCTGLRLRKPRADAGEILFILYPESLWRGALWEAVRPSVILGTLGGLLSLALAISLSRGLGRRIGELERRTRLIAAGDFSPMPLPARQDELRDLGQSVNEMALKLKELQEAVKQSERLRLLGQVGGGLAHQLRNGVTGARLAVQLHARTCNGQSDAEALQVALRQLALVETNLKRFLHLGQREQICRQACNLVSILDEAISLLRPQCRHAHIDLRWQPPPEPIIIHGEPGQLSQLLINVLGNAMEAAGPGGWVDIQFRAEQGSCLIDIEDSGPGPPPDIAGRLFEPFVTGKPEGVGLGLAVARQVAETHGGKIDWRREKDRTSFQIRLPMLSRETAASAGRGAEGEPNPGRR